MNSSQRLGALTGRCPAKDAPKEESAKAKTKLNGDDPKPTNAAPMKDSKSAAKDKAVTTKSGGAVKVTPASSSKQGSTSSAGPVKEDEVRATLLHLVASFKASPRTSELVDDVNLPPVLASKQKDAPKEESAKGKTKLNGDDPKPTNAAPMQSGEMSLFFQDSKSTVKDKAVTTKSGGAVKVTPASSSKQGSASSAGPVKEDEVRATLLHLVASFKASPRTPELENDVNLPPVPASKQKDALKEDSVDNSPAKPLPSGPSQATPPLSKSAKAKRRLDGDDPNATNVVHKKVKTENDLKSVAKVKAPTTKSSMPVKGTPSSSSNQGPTSSAGLVTEDEIRATLLQKSPVTAHDLVASFKARLRTPENKKAFADILKRISKIQMTNGPSYVVLSEKGR